MNPESSPFSPGQPVPTEFFVGRIEEIERLRSMVLGALNNRFKVGFVTGERGIGKSSLVSFVRHLMDREQAVAGCHVFLGGVRELPEMVRRTFDRLLKDSIEKPWHLKVREFFGQHVREVGLFGISVELSLTPQDLSMITHDFVPSVRRLLDKLSGDRRALLLILDDINGLASSVDFANWLKSIVDEIATSQRGLAMCLLVVGLEERRQELIRVQPSLARVFELIEIKPWTDKEVREFYGKAFEKASATVSRKDMDLMVQFTGGLPVLAHEIGDAIWRAAQKADIGQDDVWTGIVNAAEVVGRKLLEPQVFQALRSNRYRSILRKMADRPMELQFRRQDLIARLTADEKKVMDNFLRRMKDLGALVSDEQTGRGGYRFVNQLHALYFWMESQRAKRKT
ncbi:MAG TPA: ATP-binding protein [Sedimentisphaerales bacterium]|nr:ATP-binding protein [Sedimentisphaerales bacterium]HRS10754.1 ATP-binding protein [Sedimentisphaerales bacterium]HRV47459.1 ATP-binding protein [Sedimentisphaerales bacterium]